MPNKAQFINMIRIPTHTKIIITDRLHIFKDTEKSRKSNVLAK